AALRPLLPAVFRGGDLGAGPHLAALRDRGGAQPRAGGGAPPGAQAGHAGRALCARRPGAGWPPRVRGHLRRIPARHSGRTPAPAAELPMRWRARALEVWTGRGWRARPEGWGGGTWLPPLPRLRLAAARRHAAPLVADIEAVSGFSDGVVLTPEGWPTGITFQ